MMNIVAHNLLAMNANRQLGIVDKKKAKSTEKLSSGYRINRAADDAAGLSISEKMRRQIRGLHKAEENIQDGISLCQVADGALNETHDILQRMNELAVKAGNDTNSQTDRAFIQTEIDALTDEIDRIAHQTSFNDCIYPLLGNGVDDIGGTPIIGANGNGWILPPQLREYTHNVSVHGNSGYVDGVLQNKGYMGKITVVGYEPFDAKNTMHYWFGEGGFGGGTASTAVWDGDKVFSLYLSDLKVNANGHVYYTSKSDGRNRYLEVKKDANGNWLLGMGSDDEKYYPSLNTPGFTYVSALRGGSGGQDSSGNGSAFISESSVWIHMATEPGIGMFIDLVNATAKGIGIENLDMSSMENAGNAINSIKGAIEKVSGYRNVFGSQQNRLEHAMRINANIAENTTDAESRIRDTDVAKEMLTFSNENILAQAGQSMLTQANQSQQYILSLLS